MTAAGFMKAAALKKRVFETEGLINAVNAVRDKSAYFKTPVYNLLLEISKSLSRYRVMRAFTACLEADSNTYSAWQAVDCQGLAGEEACRVMDEFMLALGTSGAKEQVLLCESTLGRLERCRQNAVEAEANKARMYRSLGLLSGAFSVIILM